MFFDLFRKKATVIDVDCENTGAGLRKKNSLVIFIIMIAICFLAFGSCDDGAETKGNVAEVEEKGENEEYIKNREKQLEEVLSSVKGAGTVKVMMTFESIDERVLATNRKGSLESSVEEAGSENRSTDEENVFLFGSGESEKPYVLKEKLPVPVGVLVTATGAGSESVRLEIYKSVKALYGISGHRIKIAVAKSEK